MGRLIDTGSLNIRDVWNNYWTIVMGVTEADMSRKKIIQQKINELKAKSEEQYGNDN